MSERGTILVGTVGQGVLRSADGGESWSRVGVGQGMHSDCIVRCLAAHPRQPEVILAGTDLGLYRTDDAGGHWRRLDTPMNGRAVWALAIDDANPEMMLAGTGTPTPPVIYQTADGGETWQPRSAEFAEDCPAVGVPRPTAIAIDPTDRRTVWLGIEVDGVRRSRDGGATWDRAGAPITNPDVHNIVVAAGPPKKILVLVNDDVWVSDDDGLSWDTVGVRQIFPWHYPRGVAVRPDDPRVVFVTVGDSTPGRTGAVMRTCDAGKTWESLPLPGQPNSAMWTITVSRQDPDLVIAGSRYGYLYRSDDGGDSWVRFWREFSEISSIAWVPAA
jgi:photosystem II stability/assembly factor-like uncharacterized protein